MKMKSKHIAREALISLIAMVAIILVCKFILHMEYKDIAAVIGLIFGPVSAVLITRFNDSNYMEYERKLSSFRELMRYRCDPVSKEYVYALNLISADFDSEQDVQRARKTLLSMLNNPPLNINAWEHLNEFQRNDFLGRQTIWFDSVRKLTADLLFEVGKSLGVDVKQIDIMEAYTPQDWSNQKQLKDGFLNSGKHFFDEAIKRKFNQANTSSTQQPQHENSYPNSRVDVNPAEEVRDEQPA